MGWSTPEVLLFLFIYFWLFRKKKEKKHTRRGL